MGRYEAKMWSSDGSGPARRDRTSGHYECYIPDLLVGRSITLNPETSALLREAEFVVAGLAHDEGLGQLGDLPSLMLRTEAAASSWIEGIPPRAQRVAFAELARLEGLPIGNELAELVANNVQMMHRAVRELAAADALSVDSLVGLQSVLLGPDDRLAGIRTTQNWIGGSAYNPRQAHYVPPPPEHVDRLMGDLVGYLSEAAPPALIQAGMVHAQFETIHPFPDGNGRVGRALIHTVLARRGLARGAILPISLVLMTRKDDYIAGLAAYRHVGRAGGADADLAANAWLSVFLRAVIDACIQTRNIADDVREVRDRWQRLLSEHRLAQGLPATPRSDSAVTKVLAALVQTPVMTAPVAQRLLGLREAAAAAAFAELRGAGITTTKRDRRRTVHIATDLVALLDITDRRLASPAFDTSVSPPVRPAPTTPAAAPQSPPSVPPAPPDQQPQGRFVTPWSERARSVWAKTEDGAAGHLSLVRHLEDAAAVAGALWDHWLAPHIRSRISDGLPEGEADGRRLLTWLAALHDCGKATPGFAIKARSAPGNSHLVSAMEDHGLLCPPFARGGSVRLPPHCHLGQYLLSEWLIETYAAGSAAAGALASPVGAHHGTPPDNLALQGFRGSVWTGRRESSWRDVQFEIIEGMTRRTGADQRIREWLSHPPTEAAQVLLAAAVVVADWLASDTTRFPHDDYSSASDRVGRARLGAALRGPWRPPEPVTEAADLFSRRFPRLAGRGIHPLQRMVRDLAAAQAEPCLMVVEAPMGSGKTEAALLAAEELGRRFGLGGVFIGLPTMATSDAMFARVLDWSRHVDSAAAPTIYLAHGRARLNEDYDVLAKVGRVRGINAGENDPADEAAVVSSWLQGRRKGVLANMVVGTIDQALFGALKTRHLALRHLGLAGKVVIIDEVHAADSYMRRYLSRALEWLGAYRTPVILLSATLPPAHLADLTAAYARGRGAAVATPETMPDYPRITIQGADLSRVAVPWTDPVTAVDLIALEDDLADLGGRVATWVDAGACVAIIRNTVGRAQMTYAALRAAMGSDRVSLLHSQFVASDRTFKERQLLGRFGPPGHGVDRPLGHVVIGTQVLEQSLDIDADVMVSDLAPVDLILQRMGRLHRHRRGDGEVQRPASVRRPQFFVVGVPPTEGPPDLDDGARAVYGASALLRSAFVLSPHLTGRPVTLPTDVPTLVATAYDPELASPPAWSAEWEQAEDEADIAMRASRSRAGTFRVRSPGGQPSLVGWLDGPAMQGPKSEEALGGLAQVRDGDASLEVVVVWRDEDGVVRILPGSGPNGGADLGLTRAAPPEDHLALSVLGCSLRLPHRLTARGRINPLINELERDGWAFAGWNESPWLQGELVLCLDAELRGEVLGERIRYDSEQGLIFESLEGNDG